MTIRKNKQLSMKRGKPVPAGGSKMLKCQHTGTQTPGMTSQEARTRGGKGFAKGGTSKMFGFTGSKTQKPA